MTDQGKDRPFEERLVVVDNWIQEISNNGVVGEMDPMLLRGVLSEYGANFEISDAARESLAKYSNVNKKPGMIAVWGETRTAEIKKWIMNEFIPASEKKVGREFPTLHDPKTGKFDEINTKFSGSLQFFGELTAYAAGVKSFDDFKRQTERRVSKGKLWAEGKYEPSPNHPFPPGFPADAWKYVKSKSV